MKQILLILVLSVSLLHSQPSTVVHLLSRFPEGPCYAVSLHGSLACVGNGSALDVVDVSDNANPERLARALLPGVVQDVTISGTLAYVANGRAGLAIVDLSTPSSPQLLSSIPTRDEAVSVEVSGDNAFIAFGTGFTVIDVSSPQRPQAVSTVFIDGYVRDIAIQNDTLFLAAGAQGLLVYDIRIPSAPNLIRQIFLKGPFEPTASRIEGKSLFATSRPQSSLSHGRLHVLNLTLPDTLCEVGAISLPGDWSSTGLDVCLAGSTAYVSYVSDAGSGVSIISIDSLTNPHPIGSLFLNETHTTKVTGSTLLVADGPGGLKLFDISTPGSPLPVSSYHTSESAYNVALQGSWAFLAVGGGGIRPVDLSVPHNPIGYGPYASLGQSVKSIDILGNYAFTTSNYGSVDISDISRNDTVFRIAALGDVIGTSLKVRDSLLYVTDRDSGIFIANIADPLHPHWLGRVPVGGRTWDIAYSGSYAYVAVGSAGVRVIDVSDPNTPEVVSSFPSFGFSAGIAVSGSRAYVADQTLGLNVFDISNALSPTLLSTTPIAGFPSKVAVVPPYAYLTTSSKGVSIVDLSTKPYPQVIDSVLTADRPTAIVASGGRFYVADSRGGLFVFENDLVSGIHSDPQRPTGFRLYQNFPNPFNSATRISYELPRAGEVTITIHSILGQTCDILFKGRQEAGLHSIVWQPLLYSSGIYFYRAQYNGNSITKSALLIK